MLDTYASRPGWLDSLLTAIARVLLRCGINANSLTYFALFSGIAAGLLFYSGRPIAALLCLALSGLADAVDGRVARLGTGGHLRRRLGIRMSQPWCWRRRGT